MSVEQRSTVFGAPSDGSTATDSPKRYAYNTITPVQHYVEERNDMLLDLSMRYPHVEDYSYTKNFRGIRKVGTEQTVDPAENGGDSIHFITREDTNRDLQYDAYAIRVFNFLATLFDMSNTEPGISLDEIAEKIAYLLHYREYLAMHKSWWQYAAIDNNSGYNDLFIQFINRELRMMEDTNEKFAFFQE